MTCTVSRRHALARLACLAAPLPLAARAAAYPDKPVTFVVPFPAGGSTDALMRAIQPRLAEKLGQPVVIENQAGVGGALGAAKVANAAADGYTVLAGSTNEMVYAPTLNPNVRYKPQDFAPVGLMIGTPVLLVARADLPASSADELVGLLRARPEGLSFGSPGVGTLQHMLMEDLQARAKVRMVHVPYKGAGPLLNDVLGGQLDLAVMVPSSALPHLKSGRLKLIGVASLQRDPLLPSFPTLNEGKLVSGLESNGWIGLFVPKKAPAAAVARLHDAMAATLADPAVQKRVADLGMRVASATEQRAFPETFSRDEAKVRSIAARVKLD